MRVPSPLSLREELRLTRKATLPLMPVPSTLREELRLDPGLVFVLLHALL